MVWSFGYWSDLSIKWLWRLVMSLVPFDPSIVAVKQSFIVSLFVWSGNCWLRFSGIVILYMSTERSQMILIKLLKVCHYSGTAITNLYMTNNILRSRNSTIYYINTNEIPGELLCENLVSSHVKITCYLHMWKYHRCYGYIINRAFHTKKLLKWNGLVVHWCLYNK